MRTPRATPVLSSTYKGNGLVRSGKARAGADIRAFFILSKASWCSGVHANVFPSLVRRYSGAAKVANPGIHSLQRPAIPRISLTCPGRWGRDLRDSRLSHLYQLPFSFFQGVAQLSYLSLTYLSLLSTSPISQLSQLSKQSLSPLSTFRLRRHGQDQVVYILQQGHLRVLSPESGYLPMHSLIKESEFLNS